MVQIKCDLALPSSGQPDNTYWAIGRTAKELESRHHKYFDYAWSTHPITGVAASKLLTPEQKASSTASLNRKSRNLPDYRDKSYKVKNLRALVEGRGLDLPHGYVKKADLIKALEDAEDSATFDKFSDLPPELRTMVYTHYLNDLPQLPALPYQPPLLLSSSLVRKEAAPLFYQQCKFTLAFSTDAYKLYSVSRPSPKTQTQVAKDTEALLANTKEVDFACINKFRLQLWTPRIGVSAPQSWDIDLTRSEPAVMRRWSRSLVRFSQSDWLSVLGRIEREIRGLLKDIVAREGADKLRKEDVEAFRCAIQRSLS